MLDNATYEATDELVVRALISENPWATIVSSTVDGLVASHYPVLLDQDSDDLAVLIHVGRPDEQLHGFGASEMLLIVAGPQGYISPSWYAGPADPIPTWDFSVAHCYGIPELLGADQNLRMLTRLVDHFEQHVDAPVALDQRLGVRLAVDTVGVRLPITRFVCKLKMSQDADPQTQRQVLHGLRCPGRYSNPGLADQMQHTQHRYCLSLASLPATPE